MAAQRMANASKDVPTAPVQISTQSMEYVIRSGFAGGFAGCAAKTLIAPLDRVKILFQTRNPMYQQYSGSIFGFQRAINRIIYEEGPVGLYRGHSATLLRVFPYAGVKFVAYEQVRHLLIPTKEYEVPWRRFMAGSLSGIMAVLCTYPLDVLRVQLAYDTSGGVNRLQNTVRAIAAQGSGGFLNFFSGLFPTLLGMIPYAGVSFLAHDSCHDLFRSSLLAAYAVNSEAKPLPSGKKPLTHWAQLSAGGISGLLAQTASYPLEIIRRRMQVQGITNTKRSLLETVVKVHSEAGLRGFFVGLSIGYVKVVPMFACSFYVYERVKNYVGIE